MSVYMKNAGKICKVCGEKKALVKGMCRTCYARQYMRGAGASAEIIDHRSEKTKEIIKECILHPEISSQKIGEKYGVSGARVRKILKTAGVKRK